MKLSIVQGKMPTAYSYEPCEGVLVVEAETDALPSDGYLLLEMQMEQTSPVFLIWSFFSDNTDTPDISAMQRVMPRCRLYAGFALEALLGVATPPMPGQYTLSVSGKLASLNGIRRVRIRFECAENFERLILYRLISVIRTPKLKVLSDQPALDALGQSVAMHWPLKSRTFPELKRRLSKERARALVYGEKGAPYAGNLSEYGGALSQRLALGTGAFTTLRHRNRWYFVDPNGFAFLACGVGGEGCEGVFMHVDGMSCMCQELPDPNDTLYTNAYMLCGEVDEYRYAYKGVSAKPDNMMINFTRVSLMHAFGDQWQLAFADIHNLCLHEAGINLMDIACVGLPNTNVPEYVSHVYVPYTITLMDFPRTESMIDKGFPDVFSDEYAENCNVYVDALQPFIEDPYFFGVFFAPLPEWLYEGSDDLARRVLASKEPLVSRERLIAFLREHYEGSIELLNAAWQTEFESFERVSLPEGELSESATGALRTFNALLLEQFAAVPYEAVRRIDNTHMALGFRFARPCPALSALTTPFDVVAMRCSGSNPTETLDSTKEMTDKPILLTGFQFGTSERDLPLEGPPPKDDQEERALAIRHYMEHGFAHPACAGMIYENFFDLPPLGQYDGKTGQIGLCDIALQPYTDALREFGLAAERAYGLASGRLVPIRLDE